jgi:hypothetical protein
MEWNYILALIAGILWCVGQERKWSDTGYLGWAFWLLILFF